MGRVLQLIPTYSLSITRIGPTLTRRLRVALATEMRRLSETDTLPLEGDYEALLTPPAVGVARARSVRGVRAWLLYRFDDMHVSIWEAATQEPIAVDTD